MNLRPFGPEKMGGYPPLSGCFRICLIIPDRKATIRFSFRFALYKDYGRNKTESAVIRLPPDGKFGMKHNFGFGLFDMPKNIFFQLSTLASFGK